MFSLVTSKIYALPNTWMRLIYSGSIFQPISGVYYAAGSIMCDMFLRFCTKGLLKFYGSKHVGATHYGLGEGDIESLDFYTIKGVLRQTLKEKIKIIGDIIHYFETEYPASGSIYTPNGFGYWTNTGFYIGASEIFTLLSGNIQQDYMRVFPCISSLEYGANSMYRVLSTIRCSFDKYVKVKGAATFTSKSVSGVKGFLHARAKKICLASGRLIGKKRIFLKVRAGLGKKKFIAIKAKAAIWGDKKFFHRIKGKIKNARGEWFIKVKGKIELIAKAFAFAVPKLNQQFHTEKRWFGKTASKKEKK